MSLAAVSTTAFALLVVGLFYLIMVNLNDLMEREARKVGIQVYLPPHFEPAQKEAWEARLRALPGVVSVEFISSEEALERLKRQLGSEELFQDLGANELPASFALQVAQPEQVPPLAEALRRWGEFEEVRYAQQVTARLHRVLTLFKVGGLVVLGVLGFAACIIINNTIRLTILARQREIRIMRLVGATDSFIRAPFLLEGLFHGLAGALIAFLVLLVAYRSVLTWAHSLPFLHLVDDPSLPRSLAWVLLGMGMLFGWLGSFVSVHRCLREEPS